MAKKIWGDLDAVLTPPAPSTTVAACLGGGDSKTRGKKRKPPAQEGKIIKPREGKKQPNLSSYNIKALLPWKEIKARVK